MKLNSKIYIAGHEGLVGSNILKELLSLGYKNIITKNFKDLDLRNQQDTENFFEQEKPEYVFLAAAKVGGILANNSYPADFIYDNLMISFNVIHASFKFRVKKLLNLGSSCIYPKLAPQPLKEDYLLSGYLEPTNEAYAIAKIASIKLCRYYNEQYNSNFISVMPTNLYGIGDNFNLQTAHVLPTLIRKFHLAKLLKSENYNEIILDLKKYKLGYGLDTQINLNDIKSIINVLNFLGIYQGKLILWGTGQVYREFLHVQDLVKAIIFLMQNYDYKDIGEIINIGSGQDLTIKELANLIKEIVGFDGIIDFDYKHPDGTPKKLLDVTKIKKLGWEPKIDLKTGIKLTYGNYVNPTHPEYFCVSKNVSKGEGKERKESLL